MRYNIRHETTYSYTEPVPVCHNLVHFAPRNTGQQSCGGFRLSVEPKPTIRSRREDYFGNEVDYFSIQEAHEGLSVTATSVVDVTAPDAAEGDQIRRLGRMWPRRSLRNSRRRGWPFIIFRCRRRGWRRREFCANMRSRVSQSGGRCLTRHAI